MYEDKLYIYGGLDIQKGNLDSLWQFDLKQLSLLEGVEGPDKETCCWKLIEQHGARNAMPGPVAYHSSVVYKEHMFLFGGNNYGQTISLHLNAAPTYQPLFQLSMRTFAWAQVRGRGDEVKPRDEHSAVLDESSGTMIIFGGFAEGERTNEVCLYNIQKNIWSRTKQEHG